MEETPTNLAWDQSGLDDICIWYVIKTNVISAYNTPQTHT